MRKEQSNIEKILHFPIPDHGSEIPENKLVDPLAEISAEISPLCSEVEGVK